MEQKDNESGVLKQHILKNERTGQEVLLCNGPIKDSKGIAEVTTVQFFENGSEEEMSVYQTREDFDKFVPVLMTLFGWKGGAE